MAEINKINLVKPDAILKPENKTKEPLSSGEAFENQLLETVKKLETMGNEIDAMRESTKPQRSQAPDGTMKNITKKMDTVVENFSAAKKTSKQSAEFVAKQYERMNPQKKS